MGYYVVTVYGLICDECEATEDSAPYSDEPHKLAAARRELSKPPSNWTRRDGRDLCGRCSQAG